MRSVVIRLCAIAAFVIAGLGSASAQQWVLNGAASHFYMQTAKAESIVEIHQFTGLEGTISNTGDADVKILSRLVDREVRLTAEVGRQAVRWDDCRSKTKLGNHSTQFRDRL